MSLWRFGKFEREVDFTDADFLANLEDAKKSMNEAMNQVPKVGKTSDIILAQTECFYIFFDVLFGPGSGEAIFEGKHSLELCIRAAESITEFEHTETERIDSAYKKYYVKNHGNRSQRRQYYKGNQNKVKRR